MAYMTKSSFPDVQNSLNEDDPDWKMTSDAVTPTQGNQTGHNLSV